MAALKPYYPHKPISTVEMLARTLGVHPKILIDISERANDSYTHFVISASGKDRNVCEPKFSLKKIQKRINSRIFESVTYPSYLQGGLKDEEAPRDYVANASLHARAKWLINLDVKNFYPNIRRESVSAIFKYFFAFPDPVAEILTKLTTLHDRVPQGACTSSYIANLVFFNSEYGVVSKLHSNGYVYSRLLDDITISSSVDMANDDISFCIRQVAAMLKKHNLKLHGSEKKRIETRTNHRAKFSVTGLWVAHGIPKVRKKERRYIRQLVYACERAYTGEGPGSSKYHELWNKTSGKVAKLKRLEHAQAKQLRLRLSKILPILSDTETLKLRFEVDTLIADASKSMTIGRVKRVNRALYKIDLLGRTDKSQARALRKTLKAAYASKPTLSTYWEQ